MNVLDAIKKRRSVRSFDGRALTEDETQRLMSFAEKVENPYDLPIEWKLLSAEKNGLKSPVIVGTDTFIAGKMRREKHAEEAFGYAFEKVVLFAETLGIGTTWIAGTMNRDAFERAMALSEGEVMPCVSPLGYAAEKMSLREGMMRRSIQADSRFDFEKLFFDGSFDRPLTKDRAGRLAEVLEAVRLSPSAVNKQPWRAVVSGDRVHFYEKRSKGYVSANGWDLQLIDMGIALCHFELAAKELGMEVSLEIADPELKLNEELYYVASFSVK